MGRRTSIVSSQLLADELTGFKQDSGTQAASSEINTPGGGGGAAIPTPYFGATNTSYWPVNAVTSEDTEGVTLTQRWLVPTGTDKLVIFYKYIKADGMYGKRRKFVWDDFTENEIAAGFVEFTQLGIKANRSFDILKAVAKSSDGSRAANPISDPDPSTLPSGVAPVATVLPPQTYGGFPPNSPPFSSSLGSSVLARCVPGPYLLANIRVTAVGTPVKESDGVYFPVTVQFDGTAGVREIKLRYERCGVKTGSGTGYNETTSYGNRPRFTHWHEVTDTESTAGSCIVNVGPFGPRQAKRTWHVTRVRCKILVDDKNGDKIVKEAYPVAQADMSTTPLDLSPANAVVAASYPSAFTPGAASIPGIDASAANGTAQNPAATDTGQGAMLAVLTPQDVITVLPSDPSTGGTIMLKNEPDLSTEKDHDAIIQVKAWVNDALHTMTAENAHADEMVFVFCRKEDYTGVPATDAPFYKHIIIKLEPDDVFAVANFHRRIGKRFVWVKNVLRNSVSKSPSSGAAVEFQAGATVYIGPNASQGLTNLTVANPTYSTNEDSPGHITLSITFDNIGVANTNNLPVVPKALFVFAQRRDAAGVTFPGSTEIGAGTDMVSGDTNWRIAAVVKLKDLAGLTTDTSGATPAHEIKVQVKTRRKTAQKYAATIIAVGDNTRVNSSVTSSYTPSSDLPVGNYAHGTRNLITNGGFLFSREDFGTGTSTTNLGKNWWVNVSTSAARLDTTATDSYPYWDQASHRLVWRNSAGGSATGAGGVYAYCRIKRLVTPGETLTNSILLAADATQGATLTFTIRIVKVDDSAGTGAAWGAETDVWGPHTITATTSDFSTTFQMFYVSGAVVSSLSLAANQRLYYKITASGIDDDGTKVYVDNIMLVRGNQALSWEMSSDEEDANSNTGASATYSSTSASTFDASAGGGNSDITPGGKITL